MLVYKKVVLIFSTAAALRATHIQHLMYLRCGNVFKVREGVVTYLRCGNVFKVW